MYFVQFPSYNQQRPDKKKRKINKQENTIGNTEIKLAVNMLRMKRGKKQLVLKENRKSREEEKEQELGASGCFCLCFSFVERYFPMGWYE